jgi:hypothetical protein
VFCLAFLAAALLTVIAARSILAIHQAIETVKFIKSSLL